MIREEKASMKALRRSHTGSNTTSSSNNSSSGSNSSLSWIHLRSVLLVVASSHNSNSNNNSSSTPSSSSSPLAADRGSLKSPWSRRRRKHALLPKQWKSLFTQEGKLTDGGVKFLKKARSGGVDPSIRAEVWPFLLGVYSISSSDEERDHVRSLMRNEYEDLRKQCRRILKRNDKSSRLKETTGLSSLEDSGELSQVIESPRAGEISSSNKSPFSEGEILADADATSADRTIESSASVVKGDAEKVLTREDSWAGDTESTDSESSDEPEEFESFFAANLRESDEFIVHAQGDSSPSKTESTSIAHKEEDFATWQRIIRVDAIRANADWITYSLSQAGVSEMRARRLAMSVGLKEFDDLEPCRIYHAARLVAILEAYALYDPEIGYCQGMSDLLSPIISVMEQDDEAFWCFVGFMKKARHNFRLDEVGIRRQLGIISKIIKHKDSHLYKHLEKLEAEDCFFVYRMVVVLFRRELDLDQTLCLWEVMWADQTAIRAGIAKSAWGRIRLRAPPTDDLLLYAISACVLQRRKLIIEKYSSIDEIVRECNNMAGQLDVWKLLDDAHDLVVTLHDKI